MNRILMMALMMAALVGFAACTGDEKSDATSRSQKSKVTVPIPAEKEKPEDLADNQSEIQAIIAWKQGERLPGVKLLAASQAKAANRKWKDPEVKKAFHAKIQEISDAYKNYGR